uniref:Uncharacterized protein n=1 Tax=Theileria annulata TaxID=5874 RepID=A0A3B0MEW1_THEAN
MNVILKTLYLVFSCFLVESQGVYTRNKYDQSDQLNYLSSFFRSFNNIFSKKLIPEQLDELIHSYLRTNYDDRDEHNPVNLYTGDENQPSSTESETYNDGSSDNSIAECLLSEDENFSQVVQKFYMPLKDAGSFAKNFNSKVEVLGKNQEPFKVLNLEGNDKDLDVSRAMRKMNIKCTAVRADSISETCKACLYFEEIVLKRHFRYGHMVDCGVMECMNGYDKKLSNSPNKGYFFNDFVKYHPICIT